MIRPKGKTDCKRYKINVAATDGQLRDLLLLIGTQAVVLCEQLDVTTNDDNARSASPLRKITFAVPSYLSLSTYQIADWMVSLSLFDGQVGIEDFMQPI